MVADAAAVAEPEALADVDAEGKKLALRNAECGMRSAGLHSAERGLRRHGERDVGCGTWSVDVGVRSTARGARSAERKVRS